jgi:hypothetical protein
MDFIDTNPSQTVQARANVRAFNESIKDFAKKHAREEVLTFIRKIAFEGLRRLVMKTPVDTGRARGNWQVSINEDTDKALDTKDKSGNSTIEKGKHKIDKMGLGVCYVTNNVEYIEELERGHSRQAPAGMLAVTYEELGAILE